MEYYCELGSKNAQIIKALMYPLYFRVSCLQFCSFIVGVKAKLVISGGNKR